MSVLSASSSLEFHISEIFLAAALNSNQQKCIICNANVIITIAIFFLILLKAENKTLCQFV